MSRSASVTVDPGSRARAHAERPRVAIVAASGAARRRLRTLVRAAGLDIEEEAARLAAVPPNLASGVVIVLDGRAACEGGMTEPTTRTPVLVVTEGEGWSGTITASVQPDWSSISASASPRALRAAIAAAAAGLVVRARRTAAPSDREFAEIEPAVEELTPREREVLTLLAEGLSNRAIAARLGISRHTVKFHLAAIFGKLGASTRARAMRIALQRGLLHL